MSTSPHTTPSPKSADKPFADTRMAQFLDRHIDRMTAAGWRQIDIARAIGYSKANIIAMFKKGDTKVPINKVPALARTLGVDPAFLMRLGLQQYWPEEAETITEVLGGIYTENEKAIIEAIREASDHGDPELTAARRAELGRVFGVSA